MSAVCTAFPDWLLFLFRCKIHETWKFKYTYNLSLSKHLHALQHFSASISEALFCHHSWLHMMHVCLFVMDASYIVGWDTFTWRRNAIQSLFCYPHFLSQIHWAGLLVQEGDCSAHFSMNTIFLYLVAICFPVIKYLQPAFFFYSGPVKGKWLKLKCSCQKHKLSY